MLYKIHGTKCPLTEQVPHKHILYEIRASESVNQLQAWNRHHVHLLTDSHYYICTHSLWHSENSNVRYVKCFLPITTAMAPSANPRTRIRGATNNFPAGKQKAKPFRVLEQIYPTISAMFFNTTVYIIF